MTSFKARPKREPIQWVKHADGGKAGACNNPARKKRVWLRVIDSLQLVPKNKNFVNVSEKEVYAKVKHAGEARKNVGIDLTVKKIALPGQGKEVIHAETIKITGNKKKTTTRQVLTRVLKDGKPLKTKLVKAVVKTKKPSVVLKVLRDEEIRH